MADYCLRSRPSVRSGYDGFCMIFLPELLRFHYSAQLFNSEIIIMAEDNRNFVVKVRVLSVDS